MPVARSMADVIRNLLQYGDLSFHDFVEVALYHPEFGYYARRESPAGREGDFITAPLLSPAFAFAVGKLIDEFVRRIGDAPSMIVDIGCGDGSLINTLCAKGPRTALYAGVDRSLERLQTPETPRPRNLLFATTLDQLPKETEYQLVLSNELFDALPFARLVQRGEHLHELWVTEREGALDWSEHEADPRYDDYFARRGIELQDGQFADVSLEWEAKYDEICRWLDRGLIVTFDYGYPQEQLFRGRLRRFGTAAAYAGHRVTRDLLANPGEQDVTAHINFGDLQHTGEQHGFATLSFARQARFLLALGITEHELFKPIGELEASSAEEGIELLERRDDARRLVLPDGIGEDIRVLVQGRGVALDGWSFQRRLF